MKTSQAGAPSGAFGDPLAGAGARYGAGSLVPPPAPTAPAATLRSVARAAGRWMRTAAIAVATLYVFGFVTLTVGLPILTRAAWPAMKFENTIGKRLAADRMRTYGVAKDPSIGAAEAGMTFFALQPRPRQPGNGFENRDVAHAVPPWRGAPLPEGAFRSGQSHSYNGPDPRTIIAAAKRGLTASELAYLRPYGTADVWRDYDRVARAPKVDVVAGRLKLPFGPAAVDFNRPIPAFAATKEYAYASTARAAWFVSQGRPDLAEAALRSAVSHGLMLIDNGTTLIEELIGVVIVAIARDGLHELFDATGDRRAAEFENLQLDAAALARRAVEQPWSGLRYDGAVDALTDAVTRGTGLTTAERMEYLRAVSFASCASPRGLLFGHSAQAKAAFEAVRRDYAGLPGHLAVIDLIEAAPERAAAYVGAPAQVGEVGSALSRLYFNGRFGSCAMLGGSF